MTRSIAVRFGLLSAVVCPVLFAFACGDGPPSEPKGPAADGIITIPEEAEDLEEALKLIQSGGTILIETATLQIDSTLAFPQGMQNVTIQGRQDASGDRPVIQAMVRPGPVFSVPWEAEGIGFVGLKIEGTFDTGIRMTGPRGRIEDCWIVGARLYSVAMLREGEGTVVERNLFEAPGFFGVRCLSGAKPLVLNNTIVGAMDCGIYAFASAPVCRNNLIVDSLNWGIACFSSSGTVLDCNNIWESGVAHYSAECEPGEHDIHEDPLFCPGGSFALQADSPCVEGGGCQLIGAVGVGCGE